MDLVNLEFQDGWFTSEEVVDDVMLLLSHKDRPASVHHALSSDPLRRVRRTIHTILQSLKKAHPETRLEFTRAEMADLLARQVQLRLERAFATNLDRRVSIFTSGRRGC